MKELFKLLSIAVFIFGFKAHATEFIFIGDTGHDNQEQKEVSEALIRHCAEEKCDLGLLAGDNVYYEGLTYKEDPVLERVFDKYYNPLKIQFLVTLGNHDYGKRAWDWERGEWQIAHSKKNPYFYIPHFWYTYETEEAVIAVIDTSRIFWKKDRTVQARLIEEASQKAKAQKKWFLVLGHHPYLSNGEHGNAGKYEDMSFPFFVSGSEIEEFVEKNVCGKADFYLSGHDHNLQVIDGNIKSCNTQFIISGAGSGSSELEKRNETIFESEAPGFFRLSIHKDSIKVRAIDSNANTLFTKTYSH